MASHHPNPTKLEPPARRASRLRLERAAVDETFCDYMTRGEPYGPSEGEVEHSKAISLKRIADSFDQASDKGSVLWWLETIASAANAGRS